MPTLYTLNRRKTGTKTSLPVHQRYKAASFQYNFSAEEERGEGAGQHPGDGCGGEASQVAVETGIPAKTLCNWKSAVKTGLRKGKKLVHPKGKAEKTSRSQREVTAGSSHGSSGKSKKDVKRGKLPASIPLEPGEVMDWSQAEVAKMGSRTRVVLMLSWPPFQVFLLGFRGGAATGRSCNCLPIVFTPKDETLYLVVCTQGPNRVFSASLTHAQAPTPRSGPVPGPGLLEIQPYSGSMAFSREEGAEAERFSGRDLVRRCQTFIPEAYNCLVRKSTRGFAPGPLRQSVKG